jgi:RNA polymerase sigma-70 factor (ECF subfamily)
MTAIAERHASVGSHRPATAADTLVRNLYAADFTVVVRYACRLLADRQAGEDVAQEALLRAWRNAHVLVPEGGSARRWLLRVAHNIAVDMIRARNARPMEVSESAGLTAADTDHAERVVNTAYLRSAMAKLTNEHRAVLREVYFNGRTVAEAAVVLDVPVGTVKSRVHYALRTLRLHLEAQSAA